MRALRNLLRVGVAVYVASVAAGPWVLGGTEGRFDPSYHPHYFDGVVAEMHALKDGRCLLRGTAGQLVALMSDGQPDASFVVDASVYNITMTACDSQDRIVCAGWQEYAGGYVTLFRLDRNGQTDATFDRNHEIIFVGGKGITGVALDSQDRIVVSGGWVRFDGIYDRSCMRLLSDGTLDASFVCPLTDQEFYDIVPLSNGWYMCATGSSRENTGVVMLSENGSVVEDWVLDGTFANLHGFVDAGDGKTVCVGKTLGSDGYSTWAGVVRLDASGKEDATFDRGFRAGVTSLCLDATGRVYLAGSWTDLTFVKGTRPGFALGVARLNPSGDLDTTWPSELRGIGIVRDMVFAEDGRLLLMGKVLDFDGVRLQEDYSDWQDVVLALTDGSDVAGKARNISSRGVVGPNGTAPVIVGFIADGAVSQRVLLRAVSAGLGNFGITDTVAWISAKLYRDGEVVATLQSGWVSDAIASISEAAGAFAIENSFGNAVGVVTIPPGAYTLVITASASCDTGGTVLGEVYFLD